VSPTSPGPAHPPRPHDPARADGVVHVQAAWLDPVPARATDLALLDAREAARASRFRSERDRARYVASHAFYRCVLGGWLGLPPASVPLRLTAEGRPEVALPGAPDFNTSHADGVALIAVSHAGRVGVDVERLRELDDAWDLAGSHLAGEELATFRALPAATRSRAFLAAWTRKEAVVKATGRGLAIPLDGFDTGPVDGAGTRLVRGLPGDRSFVVASLEALPGHLAAVALEGERIDLRRLADEAVAA